MVLKSLSIVGLFCWRMCPHVSDMSEEVFPPCVILSKSVQFEVLLILDLEGSTDVSDSALALDELPVWLGTQDQLWKHSVKSVSKLVAQQVTEVRLY